MTSRTMTVVMVPLFFVAYLSGAFLGSQLSAHHEIATIWPPAGVFLAGLLLAPIQVWPILIFTAWMAGMTHHFMLGGSNFPLPTGFWLANTIEAVLGATYLNWIAGSKRPFSLASLNNVLAFACGGAIVSPAIGGLVGATVLQIAYGTPFWMTWHTWWSSCSIGTLLIAPVLLSFADLQLRIPTDKWNSTEAALISAALLVTGSWAINVSSLLTAYTVFLVLLWIALRFELRGTVLANLSLGLIALWHISQEYEVVPLGGAYSDRFLAVQLFLGMSSIFSLSIAAASVERRCAVEANYSSTQRYQHLVENTSDPMITIGIDSQLLSANNAWLTLTGYSVQAMANLSATMRDLVHPADRDRLERLFQQAADGDPIDRFDIRLITRYGKTLCLDGSCDARYENSQPVEIYLVLRDVTERKVEEQINLDYRRQLESANAKLRSLSITDSLTHLYNRRFFQQRLEEELDRAQRYSAPLSLLLIDVDHFKKFNDTYGHLAGDRVLSRVSEALMESARSNDIIARYGGEEFAAILPMTDQAGAVAVAERIRSCIETGLWVGQQITVSVGVASLGPNHTEVAQLISSADNALYASKHNGRNQVTFADANPTSFGQANVDNLSSSR